MRISKVHASMRDEIRSQGPLVNAQTGLRSRANRGVRRAWKAKKRQEAADRQLRERVFAESRRLADRAASWGDGSDPFNGMTLGEFRELADEFHQSQGFI